MFGRLLGLALAVCAWCVVAPAWLLAQANSGEIDGVVTDAQGGVLPGASVSAVHLESGFRLERLTDLSGRFFLAPLPVGRYDISIALSGFRSLTQRGVIVLIGQRIHLPLTLQIGQISDSITVTAEAPILNAASAEVSDIIDNHHVERLPLNGRQFLQLAQLGDGVVVPPGGTRGAALQQGGSLPAVDGQRSGHNIYLLDGVKVTDEYFNNLAVSPSPDAIQEFKIQKTMYPPEFGGKASALINVVTRSGTSTYHGSALEFFRHDRLDAHNFFDDPTQPVPPLRQHQFGASLGGPAGAQMFFFANYEGQRLHRSLTQTFSVPSLALRRGDFSSVGAICDPLTRTAATACMPFTGSQIPSSRLNPVAVALLSQVPAPTSAGEVQNLRAVNPETQQMNQVTMRIDRRLGDGGNLFGRFIAYGVNDAQPFGSSQLNETLVPGFGRIVTTRTRSLAVGHTHTFGTSTMNEVRFGFLDVSGGQESQNLGVDFASAVGLQGVTRDPRDVGYPQVAFGGLYSGIGDPTTFVSRRNRSAELYENLLLDRGNHRLKFGAYAFRLAFNPVNPQAARGAFTYTGQWSGNAFADFLLGYPTSAQVGIGRADEHGRTNWWHFYAQDDWRARSNVTINYGLRYEVNGQMNDVDNRLSAIDVTVPGGRFVIASDDRGQISAAAQPLLAEIPIPYMTSKDAGWTSALLEPSYRRIAPRIGMAWSIPGRRDTVVTAGFGVFLNQWAYSVQQALAQTLPFFFAKSISAAADATTPPFRTETVLLAGANGSVGGSTMNHDYRTEYARNWTASVQRQLASNTTLEVAYLRSDVFGADSSTVLNAPEPGPGPIAARRPIPALSSITAIRWDGYSIYNAVTVRVAQRLTRGLAFSASYSLSKAIDDASDPGATTHESNLPQDVRNMAAERALASFDHRHRFTGNFTYALPGAWQVSGIVTLQSGAPFSVMLGTDRANIGSGPAQRPDVTGDPNGLVHRTAAQWFDTSVFSLPAAFTFGNVGRNNVLAPGYANVDVGIHKEIALTKGTTLSLRGEVFNLLNRVNFDVPNRIAFTPNFGRIFSAQPARQMQVGARVTF
jgi:Carboxypeptidase regulatory-like domain